MTGFFTPKRPVVGISGIDANSGSLRSMMAQIRAAGATPLWLGNHANRNPAADIGKIDALVVMGNDRDIDPARYGQAPGAHTKPESATPEGKARADYEYAIMQLALQSGMPLLGICAGMQRLNVMHGGDLYQHIPDITGNNSHAQEDQHIAPFIPVIPVHLIPDSMLGHIGDTLLSLFVPWHNKSSYVENSMHHQAVHHVGHGLRPAAYAEDRMPDGSPLVEAIEADPNGPYKNQFVLGVQWHPEFGASELGPKIATRVTQEARKFARDHNREHPAYQAILEDGFSGKVDRSQTANLAPRQGSMQDLIRSQRADTGIAL